MRFASSVYNGVRVHYAKCANGDFHKFYIDKPMTRAELAAIQYYGSSFRREAPDGSVDALMPRGTVGTDVPGCIAGIYIFRAMEDGQYVCFTAEDASSLNSQKINLAAGQSLTVGVGHVAVADHDGVFSIVAPGDAALTITGPCLGLEVWRNDCLNPNPDTYSDILAAWAVDPMNPASHFYDPNA